MKEFKFFKKLTAAAVSAAMLASLGTVAFADGVGIPGAGISIDSLNVNQQQDATGALTDVYKVTVGFTTTVDNTIGMTMLTYGNSSEAGKGIDTNKELAGDSAADWDQNKYETGMKIVGVDQIDPVAKDGKGEFEFYVTTKEDGTNGYYLKKGVTALIALSGDGVTTPAVAPLTITAVAHSARLNDTVSVNVAANADDDTVKTAIADAVQALTASIYESSDATGNAIAADVALTNAEVTVTKTGDDYKASVKITKDQHASVPDAGLTISDIAVTVTKTAVDATTVVGISVDGIGKDSDTPRRFTKSVAAANYANADAIVNLFVGKKITLRDETGKIKADVTITNEMITPGNYVVGETSDYTIAVPAGQIEGTMLKVPDNFNITVAVTVSETPVVSKAELVGDAVTVEVNKTEGMTDAEIKKAVEDQLAEKVTTAKGYKLSVTVGSGAPVDVELENATYTWEVLPESPYTARLQVTAITGLADGAEVKNTITAATVTPTVTEKPAGVEYMVGDVNNNGRIQSNDWGAILNYLTFNYTNEDLPELIEDKTKWTVHYAAADVNGNGRIQSNDWGAILNYLTGDTTTQVGTKRTLNN